MPIIVREETDLFRLEPLCDIVVNPTNAIGGTHSVGLAVEFSKRYPQLYADFIKAQENEPFQVGGIFSCRYNDKTVINLVTKNYISDRMDIADVTICLRKLKRFLNQDQYRCDTIVIPVLGCGPNKLSVQDVIALFKEILDDLPNLIFVCTLPNQELNTKNICLYIDEFQNRLPYETLQKILEKTNTQLSDYQHAIITSKDDEIPLFNALRKNYSNLLFYGGCPEKYGMSSYKLQRNKLFLDICTSFIILQGYSSLYGKNLFALVNTYNLRHPDAKKDLHYVDYEVTSDTFTINGVRT